MAIGEFGYIPACYPQVILPKLPLISMKSLTSQCHIQVYVMLTLKRQNLTKNN